MPESAEGRLRPSRTCLCGRGLIRDILSLVIRVAGEIMMEWIRKGGHF